MTAPPLRSPGRLLLAWAAVLVLAPLLAACEGMDGAKPSTSGPGGPPAAPMQAAFYDDEAVCPEGCGAHVVFDPALNGTRNAFAPPLVNRAIAEARACSPGRPCMVCFDDRDASCLTAEYRGPGGEPDRFDFSARFARERCMEARLPAALFTACRRFEAALNLLAPRVNCIADPMHRRCREVMLEARKSKEADMAEYLRCRKEGTAPYNASVPVERRRSEDCMAALAGSGARRLLPAACGEDGYLGRDGRGCCSGDFRQAALDLERCGLYYVEARP